MQKSTIATLLLLSTPLLSQAAPTDLCKTFNPAENKQFVDTFSLNYITLTRSGNKVNGSFTHNFGNNNIKTANITATCNSSQLIFSWNESSSYYGSFGGTLVCQNGIYNIVNVMLRINSRDVQILAMTSPMGTCP